MGVACAIRRDIQTWAAVCRCRCWSLLSSLLVGAVAVMIFVGAVAVMICVGAIVSAICVTISVAVVCVAVFIIVVLYPPGVVAAAGRRQGHAKYTLARRCGVVRCSTPRGFGSWLSGCTTTGTIVNGSDVAAASERINWTRHDRHYGWPAAEQIMRTRQCRDCCKVASEQINWTHHRDQVCMRTASERINWTRRLHFVGCPAAGERIIWTRRLQQFVDRSG